MECWNDLSDWILPIAKLWAYILAPYGWRARPSKAPALVGLWSCVLFPGLSVKYRLRTPPGSGVVCLEYLQHNGSQLEGREPRRQWDQQIQRQGDYLLLPHHCNNTVKGALDLPQVQGAEKGHRPYRDFKYKNLWNIWGKHLSSWLQIVHVMTPSI